MKLKIKITIPDDRRYRNTYSPYDIRTTELAVDIENAVTDLLDAMQRVDMREANSAITQDERQVGRLKITLE